MKNKKIEIYKIWSCLSIVMIHVSLFGLANGVDDSNIMISFMQYATRFAVGFFIIVAGYYFKRNNASETIFKYFEMYLSIFIISFSTQLLFGFWKIPVSNYVLWYFMHIIAMMGILAYSGRYIKLFVIVAIIINFLSGVYFENFQILANNFNQNNFITYLPLFYLGFKLNSLEFKKSEIASWFFFMLALLLIFINVRFLKNDQYEFSSQLTAVSLLLSGICSKDLIKRSYSYYYTNIFLYHSLFYCILSPFFSKANILLSMFLLVILASAFSIIVPTFFKKIKIVLERLKI